MKRAVTVLSLVVVAAVVAMCEQPATTKPAGFQISGVVVNAATGAPVRGAKVTVANVGDRTKLLEMTTGEDGHFAFEHLKAGKYALVMSAHNFRQQAFEQHEGFSSAIAVGEGKSSTGIVFRAQPDAEIAGRVLGVFSEPVREGEVYLFFDGIVEGVRTRRLIQTANLNDAGEFRLKHLPAGHFYLAVAAQVWFAQYAMRWTGAVPAGQAADPAQEAIDALLDMAYPVTYYGDVTDASASPAVNTRAGETTVADFTLTPVRAARIRVKTEPGGGGLFLRQSLWGAFEMPLNTTLTSVNDETELRGVAPGHYKLSVQKSTESGTVTRSREVDATADGSDVEVGEGASPGAKVSGAVAVEGGAGSLPADASVVLMNKRSQQGYVAKLTPSGEFTFEEMVAGGRYQVIANAGPFVLRGIAANGARTAGSNVMIDENATQVTLAVAVSRGVGTVTGTAMSSDGAMAGMMIVLVPQDPVKNAFAIRRDQSDSDGTFTLPQVVPGKYTVIALRNGWEMEWNDPQVLRGYLARGTTVTVQERSKQDITVQVQ